MAINRVFIDWKQPLLQGVAEDLVGSCNADFCDLSDLVVVFPGRQAARRFLEILTDAAGGRVISPKLITVGSLPELLYEPKLPFASLLTQQLAWVRALRELSADKFEFIIHSPPESEDHDAWLQLGDLLRRQHVELAADRLTFSDVAGRGRTLDGFDEAQRWSILSEAQQKYLSVLDDLGLWDQQTARLEAIKRAECRTENRIITVGTVDLNRTLRAMLDQVADQVTAYIHAPQEEQASFDDHGCLIPDAWTDRQIELDAQQVQVVDDSLAQAAAVVRLLRDYRGRFALDEITVAVPDEQMVRHLRRSLAEWNISTDWPVDSQLSRSGPYRLLLVAADYIQTRRTDHFSAIIRHPDVTAWLGRRGLSATWLTEWDGYFQEHLQRRIGEVLADRSAKAAARLQNLVHALLQPLDLHDAPLSSWEFPVRGFLQNVYGNIPLETSPAALLEACSQIQEAFAAHALIPAPLDMTVSGPEAIRITLSAIGEELLAQPPEIESLHLSGWLDVPLDDAPAAIVTSFNEGLIPSSVNHDLFLPNRLRSHLGIVDNARRYARDLYAMLVVLRSRRDVRLIVARRSVTGDPLAPSRLLFACDPVQIAERVLQFFDADYRQPATPPLATLIQPAEASAFHIPRPQPRRTPPAVFRVTEFRDYLASPYRYYLRHVLQLGEVSDDVDELDAAAFGTLIHLVLQKFGESEIRHASDEREIAEYLDRQLDRSVLEQYGKDPLSAVLIQVEQCRRRLAGFAKWQSQWRAAGWEIHSVELRDLPHVPFLLGDGRSISIKGRLDRIDYHREEKQWAIFDYKTGDAGHAPDKSHRYQGEWVDLQLPLYRHLARQLGVDGDVRLGYIVLPRDTDGVREHLSEWSQAELLQADEVARAVAKKILNEEFWEELSLPPGTLTEFNGICQTGVFGREAVL